MTDVDEFLAHYGVPGMKWGKRKQTSSKSKDKKDSKKSRWDRKTPNTDKKPLSAREKVLIGGVVASGVLVAASGLTVAGLNVRKNQYKIRSATVQSWVENLLAGDTRTYQNVKPETFRNVYPKGKEALNLVKQHVRNKAMLDYYLNS